MGLFDVIHLTQPTYHDNTDDDKEWCALTDALERGAEGEKPAAMCAALTHIYSSAYSVRIALKNAEWGLRTLGGVPLRPWILLECGAFANMVAAGTVRDTSRISRWLLDSIFPSVKSPQMVHLRAVFSLVMAERAPVTATTCPETLHMDISLLENTRHVFNRTICAGVVTHIIHGMCAAHPNVPADAICAGFVKATATTRSTAALFMALDEILRRAELPMDERQEITRTARSVLMRQRGELYTKMRLRVHRRAWDMCFTGAPPAHVVDDDAFAAVCPLFYDAVMKLKRVIDLNYAVHHVLYTDIVSGVQTPRSAMVAPSTAEEQLAAL